MRNVYINLMNKITNYPRFRTIGYTTKSEAKKIEFAKGVKEYAASGEFTIIPQKSLRIKLVEEFFNICKDAKFLEEVPFFKKTSETKSKHNKVGIVITKANGKGLSTETTLNMAGIRQYKVEKRLNKEGTHYDFTRYAYNDKGTEPKIVSKWVRKA